MRFSTVLPPRLLPASLIAALLTLGATPSLAIEKVRLGYTRTATDIAIYVAHKRGYFAAENIEVAMTHVQSASQMMAPMASGELEVMAGSVSAGLFNAVQRGLDIRIVASKVTTPKGFTSQTLLGRKEWFDSGKIRSIADLKGQKIASGSPGSGALGTLSRMLKTGGLTLKDVDLVYLAFPQMLPALKNGAVAAILPAEPYTMQAVRDGIGAPLSKDDEVYPGHEIASFIFAGSFINQRRPVALGFLKAVIRGARDHNDALDENGRFAGPKGDAIVEILNEYTGAKDPNLFRSFPLAYCDPDGKISVDSLREDLMLFQELGLIQGQASVEKLVDDSLRQQVIKELGLYVKK